MIEDEKNISHRHLPTPFTPLITWDENLEKTMPLRQGDKNHGNSTFEPRPEKQNNVAPHT
jgi:hypothetical protein